MRVRGSMFRAAEFDTLMKERIIPQVEDLIAPEVLHAAQDFVAR